LSKQFVESQTRYKVAEDKLDQTIRLYEETKKSKDDLYEKHMISRDTYKSEYETRLTQELDELKIKTNQEIEKLRINTKEFYEREIKNLKETRDAAVQDKEKHELNEKELNARYQEAVNELRIVQIGCEHKVSEYKSELKLKVFELDRANMLNEENINMHQKILNENEKLQKKIEIIQNEYYHMQVQNDKRMLELENDLNERKSRLESYEKVENEMDSIIRQVAESSETGIINENEAEKVLSSYGYGANIVLNSKRRIQQNVHLTKRILHLEQLNTSLRVELNKEKSNLKDLTEQVLKYFFYKI
jgi:progesterone-induced-blocking factor 1